MDPNLPDDPHGYDGDAFRGWLLVDSIDWGGVDWSVSQVFYAKDFQVNITYGGDGGSQSTG